MKPKTSRALARVVVWIGVSMFSISADAREDLGNGWGPSALEISQLPDYCQAQFNSKIDPKIYGPLSPGCAGIHHFCAGRVLLLRVSSPSIPKAERRRILGQAKIEVNYLASRLTPSCKRADEVRAVESVIKMHETFLK